MKKRSIVVIVLSVVFAVTACILLAACNNNKLNDTTQNVNDTTQNVNDTTQNVNDTTQNVRPVGSKELRVTTNIPEAVTVSGSGYYMYNDSIRATATIKEGYEFLGWYVNDDDCVSNQTVYNGKMWNQDVEFSAKVIKKPQSVINDNGGNLSKDKSYVLEVETLNLDYGLVSLNNGRNQEEYTAQYHYGDKFKVLAYSNTETRFIGWYGMSGELITTNATFTMTMPYFDYSLFAVWGNSTDDVNIPKREFSYLLINDKYTVKSYYGGKTLVKIPSTYKNKTVMEIGEDCFKNNKTITEIVIPTSIKSIGNNAFSGCVGFKSVFYLGTTEWESIKIAENNAPLKNATVYKYNENEEDTIVEGNYWYYVDGVPTVSCKHNYISGYCANCGKKYYTAGLEYHYGNGGYYVAKGSAVDTNIIIPDTRGGIPVTGIEDSAFYNCSGLNSVTIPDSVTNIGENAFFGCSSLTSITIPDSVTSIGASAFWACSGLTSVTIPDGVTSIGDNAFYKCSSLTSITIPDSVTSIGSGAFEGCSSLTSITIPDSVTSIGIYAFYDCSSLTSITIPDSVTSIDRYAFYGCSSLTSITIPDSVTSIGDNAFYKCSSLTSITIPDSVTSIGIYAFYDCSSLTSITFKDTSTWYMTNDYYDWDNKAGGTKINVTNVSTNATYFKSYFDEYYWYKL